MNQPPLITARGALAWPIFVYGSLRQGFFNYEKALAGRHIAVRPARVRGLVYHMPQKGYPALAPGAGWVAGELFWLSDTATLARLDEIENYAPGRPDNENEYLRRLTPVVDDATGEQCDAWVYWYAAPVAAGAAFVPVPGGDWKAFMQGGDKGG